MEDLGTRLGVLVCLWGGFGMWRFGTREGLGMRLGKVWYEVGEGVGMSLVNEDLMRGERFGTRLGKVRYAGRFWFEVGEGLVRWVGEDLV